MEEPTVAVSPDKYIAKVPNSVYSSGERRIILHVYGVLRKENPNLSKRDVCERVHVLTGASRATIERLRKEFDNGPLVTPGKKRPSQNRLTRVKKYTDFEKTAIRRKVHQLYRENIPPTSDKITMMVNEDPDLPNISSRTMRRLLNDLGFRFERRQRRSYLIEHEDIVQWRREYLVKIKRFREEGKKIFYLDETWCNAGHTTKKHGLLVTSSQLGKRA
jgi:hypothetical protein